MRPRLPSLRFVLDGGGRAPRFSACLGLLARRLAPRTTWGTILYYTYNVVLMVNSNTFSNWKVIEHGVCVCVCVCERERERERERENLRDTKVDGKR